MLRSGRGASGVPGVTERPPPSSEPQHSEYFEERVEYGLLEVGRRLQTVLTVLTPYRTEDGRLGTAYVAAHDALGDLAATYTWVTLERQPARPARPGRRRRPWGG